MAESYPQTEEMVVGLFDIGEIRFIDPISSDIVVKDPDYPEEIFKKLKSGRMSPHYVNGRNLTAFSPSRPQSVEFQLGIRDLVVNGMGSLLDDLNDEENHYDHLLGLPEAMTPITSMLGQSRGLSVLWKRVDSGKKYGIHEQLQGYFAEGERVVVQDNVITDSATKKEVLPVLHANGLHLVRFDVLIDREEGGREELSSVGYDFAAVVGMNAVVNILAENGRITPQQVQWANIYRERTLANIAIESE